MNARPMAQVIRFDLESARALARARALESEADALLERATGLDAPRAMQCQWTRDALQLRAEARKLRQTLSTAEEAP